MVKTLRASLFSIPGIFAIVMSLLFGEAAAAPFLYISGNNGGSTTGISVVDTETGMVKRQFGSGNDMAMSVDGKVLYFVPGDLGVSVFDVDRNRIDGWPGVAPWHCAVALNAVGTELYAVDCL